MRRLIFILVLVAAPSVATGASAAPPWEQAALTGDPQEILRAVSALPSPDADVDILYHEGILRIDDRHRMERTMRTVYRCLTRQSLTDWSLLTISWSPWYEERPQIRARVITPEGRVHELDAATIGESPVASGEPDVLTDQRQLRVPLPAMSVGVVVEMEIVTKNHRAFFEHGASGEFMLAGSGPVRKLRLTVETPADSVLKYEVRGLEVEPRTSRSPERHRLVIECGPTQPIRIIEPAMPPSLPRTPYVVVSTAESWQAVAAGYAAIVERQLAAGSAAARALVKDLAVEGQSREQLAAQLLSRLQNRVRFTGIEFGASSIVPATPDQTLRRGYGDCKDQATLLVAMLRAAGGQAHVALLRTGDTEDTPVAVPRLAGFNHAIVCLPGDKPLWIDPVVPYLRIGELPWLDQGRRALVAAPNTRELTLLPKSTSADNRALETHQLFFSEAGRRVVMTYETHGTLEQEIRQLCASTPDWQWRRFWQAYLKDFYRGGTLQRLESTDVGDLSSPFRLTAELVDLDVTAGVEGAEMLHLEYSGIFERIAPLVQGGDIFERQHPFYFEPHTVEQRYEITPAPGFAVAELPADATERFGPATVSRESRREGEAKISTTVRFDSGPGTLTPREAAWLAAFLRGSPSVPLEFKLKAVEFLEAGDLPAALRECARLVELQPHVAAHHRRYAEVLGMAGFGKAARQHMQLAVRLDPDSSLEHGNLGYILACDLFGRYLQPGFDVTAADAALRRAIEIGPDDPAILSNYGEFLQFNAAGNRITSADKMSAALGYLRRALALMPDDDGRQVVEEQLLRALFYAGDDEALARGASRLPPSPMRNALLLTATAVLEGADRALAMSTQLAPGKQERDELIGALVELLSLGRHYELVVELLEKTTAAEEMEARWGEFAVAHAHMKKYENARLPPSDPRYPVQRLLWLLLAGYERSDEVTQLLAKPDAAADLMEIVEITAVQLRQEIARSIPAARRGDEIALHRFAAEGADNLVQRVLVRNLLSEGTGTWFVTKTEAGYRLWDAGEQQWRLGAEALRQLEQNDTAAARQLLDWAWTEHEPGIRMFDSFGGTPFARFWATSKKEDPRDLRIAAAMLGAEGTLDRQVIDVLANARQAETSEPSEISAARQLQMDRALARAASRQDPAQAVVVAQRILAVHPGWAEPSFIWSDAQRSLGQTALVRQLAQQRYAAFKNDVWALDMLATLALEAEEPQQAVAYLEQLASYQRRLVGTPFETPPLPSRILQQVGWKSLRCGRLSPETLRRVQVLIEEAIDASPIIRPQDAGFSLQVAALRAEVGEPEAARDALLTSVAWRFDPTPLPEDEYVLCRIAENYGLLDVAQQGYQELLERGPSLSETLQVLVRRRLTAVSDKLGNAWKAKRDYDQALRSFHPQPQARALSVRRGPR